MPSAIADRAAEDERERFDHRPQPRWVLNLLDMAVASGALADEDIPQREADQRELASRLALELLGPVVLGFHTDEDAA